MSINEMSRLMRKPTKRHVRPAKTQINLGIHPVWSESLLSAWKKLGSLANHWAHSEDSDQTGRMIRLIWVFTGRTCHLAVSVMRWLKYLILHLLPLSPVAEKETQWAHSVKMTSYQSMRRDHVASTLIRRHFDIECLLRIHLADVFSHFDKAYVFYGFLLG